MKEYMCPETGKKCRKVNKNKEKGAWVTWQFSHSFSTGVTPSPST